MVMTHTANLPYLTRPWFDSAPLFRGTVPGNNFGCRLLFPCSTTGPRWKMLLTRHGTHPGCLFLSYTVYISVVPYIHLHWPSMTVIILTATIGLCANVQPVSSLAELGIITLRNSLWQKYKKRNPRNSAVLWPPPRVFPMSCLIS